MSIIFLTLTSKMSGQEQVLQQSDCGVTRNRLPAWKELLLDWRTLDASCWGIQWFTDQLFQGNRAANLYLMLVFVIHFFYFCCFRRGIQAGPLYVGHCKHEYQGVWRWTESHLLEQFSTSSSFYYSFLDAKLQYFRTFMS